MNSVRTEFENVALPWMNVLYRSALKFTRNKEDAGDLVQETYMRAYRTFSTFTSGTNCRAWLFKIMYSIFVNNYRKKQREPEPISLDQIEKRFAELASKGNFEPEQTINAPEVDQALSRLPEEFKSALILVDVEELTYEEAAAALNSPIGTLRSRLFRGRKLLFVLLQDYAKAKGYLPGFEYD